VGFDMGFVSRVCVSHEILLRGNDAHLFMPKPQNYLPIPSYIYNILIYKKKIVSRFWLSFGVLAGDGTLPAGQAE
jgi:hypothetical protein